MVLGLLASHLLRNLKEKLHQTSYTGKEFFIQDYYNKNNRVNLTPLKQKVERFLKGGLIFKR